MNEQELEPRGFIKNTIQTSGEKAASQALRDIRDRSYSGRHPELGKMINCQICHLRHRQNDPLFQCKQKFADKDGVVYGELKPPEGLIELTKKQVVGAAFFSKRRINPHSNRYLQARLNKFAAQQRKKKLDKEANL